MTLFMAWNLSPNIIISSGNNMKRRNTPLGVLTLRIDHLKVFGCLLENEFLERFVKEEIEHWMHSKYQLSKCYNMNRTSN